MNQYYPYIENADKLLEEKCIEGIDKKYTGELKETALARIRAELNIVKGQGAASGFLVVLNALEACQARAEEYCFRGTLASSLIVYVIGVSDLDPIQSEPRLYMEFCYGLHGDRSPAFEMIVTKELQERLWKYFENYPGDERVERKYDSLKKPIGVYIGDIGNDYAPGDFLRDTFYINFTVVEESDLRANLLNDEIIKVCRPKTLAEYVKCYGLKHSTDAWTDNQELLFKEGAVKFDELLGNREDVYEYLLDRGIEKEMAYTITEYVRKGKVKSLGWKPEMTDAMDQANIPNWFRKSCELIRYLFPRAHAMMLYKRFCTEI